MTKKHNMHIWIKLQQNLHKVVSQTRFLSFFIVGFSIAQNLWTKSRNEIQIILILL